MGAAKIVALLFAKSCTMGWKIALVCVYAPNSFDKQFYDTLNSILLDLLDYQLLIRGDFSAAWLHSIDRTGQKESNDQKMASSELHKFTNEYGLCDAWRLMNPHTWEFSFYSACHKTFSRIEYIFISKSLFQTICSSEMIPFALTDHRAVFSTFVFKSTKPRAARWWFNCSLLKNDNFMKTIFDEFEFFISVNLKSVDDL